jgi:hypothetical protein
MRRRTPESRGPKAIDPRSGFEIRHSDLTKEWNGHLVDYRRADRRHPQDFVRAKAERMDIPNPRPELPDRFMATNILWEDGSFMFDEDGGAILGQGEVVVL